MNPSLAELLAPQLAAAAAASWPAHNGPMSPAAFKQWMAIRQQQLVADPYGFAFGPRQPVEGYRPNPFGVPSPPPVGYGQHWSGPRLDTTGWGSSGWDFGKGASQQPGVLPLGPGRPGIQPRPLAKGLINPIPALNRLVNL